MKESFPKRGLRLRRILGAGVLAVLLGHAVLAAMPAPAQPAPNQPWPYVVPAPGSGLQVFPGTSQVPNPWGYTPRATDRCLIPPAEIDPRFIVPARVVDERMIVPPAVVGRPAINGRFAPKR